MRYVKILPKLSIFWRNISVIKEASNFGLTVLTLTWALYYPLFKATV